MANEMILDYVNDLNQFKVRKDCYEEDIITGIFGPVEYLTHNSMIYYGSKKFKRLLPYTRSDSYMTKIILLTLIECSCIINKNEFRIWDFIKWLSTNKTYALYRPFVLKAMPLKKEINETDLEITKDKLKLLERIDEEEFQSFVKKGILDDTNLDKYRFFTVMGSSMPKQKMISVIYYLNGVFLDVIEKNIRKTGKGNLPIRNTRTLISLNKNMERLKDQFFNEKILF